jgi:Cu(I)-responsive transcriptional regulator
MTVQTMMIGQVAREAGVGVETVRFYERQGLLDEPGRRDSGYRQYGADAIARLRLIKRAKHLGFTLKEIKALLALRRDPEATPSDVRDRALAKIADIDARVRDLQRMKAALVPLTEACDGHGPLDECPILRALEEPTEDRTDRHNTTPDGDGEDQS